MENTPHSYVADSTSVATSPDSPARSEARWSLGFVAALLYLVVEYMRISAQYRVLLPFHVGKVVVLAMVLGWLVSPRIQLKNRVAAHPIDLTMVLLMFSSFFSTIFAEYSDPAWEGFADLLRWAVIYFLLGRIVTSPWRYRAFIFLLLLLNLKLAQAGIRSFYNARDYWGEMVAVREGARAGSVGFFSNSADFGLAMCVVWPIAVMLLFSRLGKIWRAVLLTCSIVMFFAIMVCGSRGAGVGAVGIVLAGAFLVRKRLAIVLMALLLIPGVLFVIPQASKERFRSAWNYRQDKTAMSRLTFWKAGLRMYRDNPLLGVGPKNFSYLLVGKYAELGTGQRMVPHSTYIEVLSELGTAGLIPFLALLVLFFRLNGKSRKQLQEKGADRRSFEYLMTQGLDLAMVGYMTSGAFIAVFSYPHLWVLLGLSVGLNITCAAKPAAPLAPSVQTEAQTLEVSVSQEG